MNSLIFPVISGFESKLPYHVVTIGTMIEQPNISRPVGMPDYQWLHCNGGSGILNVDGNEYEIGKGSGFFLKPDAPHVYYPVEKPWLTSWITFNGYGVPRLLDDLGLHKNFVFDIAEPFFADHILEEIYECISVMAPNWSAEASAMLYSFLINMGSLLDPKENDPVNLLYNQLNPVIIFIEKNFSQDISLEDLAQVIGITPSHFCRLFKKAYSIRPFAYLNKFRIQKAKELMYRNPGKPINDISKAVGFNNFSYFCSTFKKFEKLSPTEFEKLYMIRG